MFSISTVASSTSTPTASARPPSVMMLIVCPVAHSNTTAASSANGMFSTTISALRQSRRNNSTIRPVSSAPSSPSVTRPRIEFVTYGDWSNSSRTSTSSGTTFLKSGMRRLHCVDDGQRRCIGALRHRDVHRALAVHVRVGGHDIGAVLNGADVAQINRRA